MKKEIEICYYSLLILICFFTNLFIAYSKRTLIYLVDVPHFLVWWSFWLNYYKLQIEQFGWRAEVEKTFTTKQAKASVATLLHLRVNSKPSKYFLLT
jgi:hypothetical protein